MNKIPLYFLLTLLFTGCTSIPTAESEIMMHAFLDPIEGRTYYVPTRVLVASTTVILGELSLKRSGHIGAAINDSIAANSDLIAAGAHDVSAPLQLKLDTELTSARRTV